MGLAETVGRCVCDGNQNQANLGTVMMSLYLCSAGGVGGWVVTIGCAPFIKHRAFKAAIIGAGVIDESG